MTIPLAWMPDVPMKRVICHWTAGTHRAGPEDLAAYHFLIEGDGRLVKGDTSIALNSRRVKKGYAAHTLNCNSGSIGISLCCMGGAQEQPFRAGNYPMTAEQWSTLTTTVAELCARYRIRVTPRTVLSHAEVESNLGIKQRGKWDISRLPFDPGCVGAGACGDRLRRDVEAAMRAVPQVAPVGRGFPVQEIVEKLTEIAFKALSAGLKTLGREIVKRMN